MPSAAFVNNQAELDQWNGMHNKRKNMAEEFQLKGHLRLICVCDRSSLGAVKLVSALRGQF